MISVVATAAIAFLHPATSLAKGPKSGPAYTVVDLPGPDHEANGGQSQAFAEKISDMADGIVFVLGDYNSDTAGRSLTCLWIVDDAGVDAIDISLSLDWGTNVNSSGVVSGKAFDRPAVRLADGTLAFLESDPNTLGDVKGLNNANTLGVFQAVGVCRPTSGPVTWKIWDVTLGGTVIAATELVTPNGELLSAHDISDTGLIGGFLVGANPVLPAVGAFDGNGALGIFPRPNPNPTEIDGFRDLHVDDGGSLLDAGYELVNFGEYSRAVYWPAAGGAVDLGPEFNVTSIEGNGIALVNGVTQVVGRAASVGRGTRAYLLVNGSPSDLGPMSSGEEKWTFDRAEGINSSGMFCGVGKVVGWRNGFPKLPTEDESEKPDKATPGKGQPPEGDSE